MAEEQNSQIKSPLVKKELSTEHATEKAVTNAIKKTLPVIAKTTSKIVAAPAYVASQAIIESSKVLSKPINVGFDKVKDIGSDLIVDIKDTAKELLSPGALITTMTGSPLLGSFVSNGIESSFDKIESIKDTLFSKQDNNEELEEYIYELKETTEKTYQPLERIEASVDTLSEILLNILSSLMGLQNVIVKDTLNNMKMARLRELREAESQREALELEKKKTLPKPEIKKGNDKGFFDSLKENAIYIWQGLKNFLSVLWTGVKFFMKKTPIILGVIEFFRSLFSGEDIIKSLTNASKEMVKSFLMFFTIPIDLIGRAFGKDLDITGWVKDWTNAVFDGISSLFHGDWEQALNSFIKFGELTEKMFNDIVMAAWDYLVKPTIDSFVWLGEKVKEFINSYIVDPIYDFFEMIGDTFSNIADKVKSFLPSWLGGSDKEEPKIEKNIDSVKPILESSKQISELQRPIQTTIINNNTNNMTQMSNNNAIGKTNMIVQSSLRNTDPTFNQCLMNNFVPNM